MNEDPAVLPVVELLPEASAPSLEPEVAIPAWKAELNVRRRVVRRVAEILQLAYRAVDQGKNRRCMHLCEEILLIDPAYPIALDLYWTAASLHHTTYARLDWLTVKMEDLKRQTDESGEDSRIPFEQGLRIPDAEAWSVLSACVHPAAEMGGSGDSPVELDVIHQKLATMVIDLKFPSSPLEDVLSFIRDFSGLNILLDAKVRDRIDPDPPVSIYSQGFTLGEVLRVLLSPLSMDYQVTEERVVLLTYQSAR